MIGPVANNTKFLIKVMMIDVEPTERRVFILKLKPRVKSKKMTPNSAHTSTEEISETVGMRGKLGPTKKPASR